MYPIAILYTVLAALRPVYASGMYWLYDIAGCIPFLSRFVYFAEECIADIFLAIADLSEPKLSLKVSRPATGVKSPSGEVLPAGSHALRQMITSKLLAD
jgi:hypothetical protein